MTESVHVILVGEIDGRAAAVAASGFAIIRSPLILLQRATIILHGAEVL
jgi:hypothetical protein